MGKLFLVVGFVCVMFAFTAFAQENYETDSIKTSAGNLEITFIGHGTLMFTFGGIVIHVDPWGRLADYSKMPKADIILLTHHHRDHLDSVAVERLLTEKTTLILTETCSEKIKGGVVMKNGDLKTEKGLKIEAVPSYNLVHMRSLGGPFSPKRCREWICHHLREQKSLCGRGYGKYSRNEKFRENRYSVFADEPAIYHDTGDGCQRCKDV